MPSELHHCLSPELFPIAVPVDLDGLPNLELLRSCAAGVGRSACFAEDISEPPTIARESTGIVSTMQCGDVECADR